MIVSEVMNSRYDFRSRSDIFSAVALRVEELEIAVAAGCCAATKAQATSGWTGTHPRDWVCGVTVA